MIEMRNACAGKQRSPTTDKCFLGKTKATYCGTCTYYPNA
jgi:hypothetical protein